MIFDDFLRMQKRFLDMYFLPNLTQLSPIYGTSGCPRWLKPCSNLDRYRPTWYKFESERYDLAFSYTYGENL